MKMKMYALVFVFFMVMVMGRVHASATISEGEEKHEDFDHTQVFLAEQARLLSEHPANPEGCECLVTSYNDMGSTNKQFPGDCSNVETNDDGSEMHYCYITESNRKDCTRVSTRTTHWGINDVNNDDRYFIYCDACAGYNQAQCEKTTYDGVPEGEQATNNEDSAEQTTTCSWNAAAGPDGECEDEPLPPVACQGGWEDCNTYQCEQVYKITTQPENGGQECGEEHEARKPCENTDICEKIDCEGAWYECSKDEKYLADERKYECNHDPCKCTKEYYHKVTAKNGGAECTIPMFHTEDCVCESDEIIESNESSETSKSVSYGLLITMVLLIAALY